jgi:hypothetical protein
MKPFVIATLSLCVALLCLALSLSQLAEEHNLPDPAMSSSASFHSFVCRGCYERGQGCYRSHFSQQTVSERGKGCPDHHNGVQTIWQGRGSRGRSSGWGWAMASATRRRSGRSHRARQAISYVIAMSYDHIVGNTVRRIYLTLRQS